MSAKPKPTGLEIVVHSVRNKRKSIHLEWAQGTDSYSVDFHDNPLPSLYKALEALKPHVCSLCEFAAKDAEKIVPTGITVNEKGDNAFALITAKKTIKKGKRVFNIATPLLPMYEDAENESTDFMEDEQAKAIEKVIAEAKKYIQGERAQGQIEFKDDDDDAPVAEKKGDKTVPFPAMEAGAQQ